MSSPDRTHAWDGSPSALVTLHEDGTVLDANATFLAWTGRTRSDVVGKVRLPRLLSVGGRIYWETHVSPLLHADGRVDEVALELAGPHGRMPVLLSAVAATADPASGDRPTVHVAMSSARERSRYERELLAARRTADTAASRARILLSATAALSRAPDVGSVVSALLTAVTATLGGASATVWVTGNDGLQRHTSVDDEPHLPPEVSADGWEAIIDGDRLTVPLRGISALHGVLSVAPPAAPRVAGTGPLAHPASEPLDTDALSAIAQQAGLALDRAALYERSANVAHELQQSLLHSHAPVDPRFVVTTSYRPGVSTLEVGGDWYDSFLPHDGVLAVVVGDVVGKGLRAASGMGQLRSAVRAVSGPGVGPAGLLTRLDRFVEHVPVTASATLVFGEVDLASGRLRYACAGHMPPVIIPATGPARLLWDGRSTPLGVGLPRERTQGDVRLAPGDQVLFYTDGLIERRDRALPDRLIDLVEASAALRDAPPVQAVEQLTARMLRPGEGHDDVCTLLLGWSGAA